MKKGTKLLWTSALLLSLTGCSSASSGGTDSPNVLNLSKENDVITLDSTLATDGMSFEVINMMIEGLKQPMKTGTLSRRWPKAMTYRKMV